MFRGTTGNWYMGFSSKFDVITHLAAELFAVQEGLLMTVDYEIQNLKLETDAQSLLTTLDSVNGNYHHELTPVLSDVAILISRFKYFVVKHIPRAKNKVAHSLAHYALMAVGHKFFLNPATPFLKLGLPRRLIAPHCCRDGSGSRTQQKQVALWLNWRQDHHLQIPQRW